MNGRNENDWNGGDLDRYSIEMELPDELERKSDLESAGSESGQSHVEELHDELVDEPIDQQGHTDDISDAQPLAISKTAAGPNAKTFSENWSTFVLRLHRPIQVALQKVTQLAVHYPRGCISLIIFISLFLFIGGLRTDFVLETDALELWTPVDAVSRGYREWVQTAGFPGRGRPTRLVFHEDGKNVLYEEAVSRVFEVLGTLEEIPKYREECERKDACSIEGVTQYWNNSAEAFQNSIGQGNFLKTISARSFPNGDEVFEEEIFGKPQRDGNGTLTNATAFMVDLYIRGGGRIEQIEKEFLSSVLQLRSKWAKSPNSRFRGEIVILSSLSDEFQRSVVSDLPLIPIIFLVMSIFTVIYFARRDAVYSRSLLGFSAVVSTLLSIMAGFGLMFCLGVEFSALTQLVTFVIFGIGLDDTFVLMGAFDRTDPTKSIHERIETTMNDIGVSITLTTLTTSLAFALGALSKVPAIDWLCIYAVPTVLLEYLYQVTFFVACVVLDDRRIQQRRRDCLVCCKKAPADTEASREKFQRQRQELYEKWMNGYGHFLLRPRVKVTVLVVFVAFTGACVSSALQIRQEFSTLWLLPDDSYAVDFYDALEDYGNASIFSPSAYFRNEDASTAEIQEQMENFVNDLTNMESISNPPNDFWLPSFQKFVNETKQVQNLTFEDQVRVFSNVPGNKRRYSGSFSLLDANVSRVELVMDNVPENDVTAQINALKEQRKVVAEQPINAGKDHGDFSFFLYDNAFELWEFQEVAVHELLLTTALAISVMSAVTILFVPHWTAVCYVFPIITILYVDLLGVLNWGGVSINAVTYIALVLSIGLLVDYVLHMIFRFMECEGNRKERTIRMLETMGISVLVGGITTFLGTMALAFSSNEVLQTLFICFLGLVILGIAHSLILIPVLLSCVGPQDIVIVTNPDGTKEVQSPETAEQSASLEESMDETDPDL